MPLTAPSRSTCPRSCAGNRLPTGGIERYADARSADTPVGVATRNARRADARDHDDRLPMIRVLPPSSQALLGGVVLVSVLALPCTPQVVACG